MTLHSMLGSKSSSKMMSAIDLCGQTRFIFKVLQNPSNTSIREAGLQKVQSY